MKRVILCSQLLLLTCLIMAGTLAAPFEDSDFLSRDRDSDRDRDRDRDKDKDKDKDKGKEASKLIDNTIMEVLREVIREQNKSSKSSDKGWTEMMSRSLPWVPLMMMMMGRGSSPPPCPCMMNPYATYPGAMPHFMGQHPYYGGYNPQYRFPESYPPNIPFPQNQNPLAELNGPTSLDTRRIRTTPNFSRPYNYYGQQPYPMAAAASYYPDSPYLTAEDYIVQQPGIMQAIKARLKSELAGVATKINPGLDQAQPLMTPQSPSSAHQSVTARKTLSPHQSPAVLVSSDYHQPLPSKMLDRSASSGAGQQPSRSTKSSFWKQVTSAL